MKRFFTFYLVALLACFSVAKTNAQVVGACPPRTVSQVTLQNPVQGCNGAEIVIDALVQQNSYYAYLYAAADTVNAISSVEIIGTTTFPLSAFGDTAMTIGSNYRVKVVPISTNLNTLPQYATTNVLHQYAMTTAVFQASASIVPTPAANARGVQPNAVLACNGIIDVNIVTRPSQVCTPIFNISVFLKSLFSGTVSPPSPNDPLAAAIQTPNSSGVLTCKNNTDYLGYLYSQWLANKDISFNFASSGKPIRHYFGNANSTAVRYSVSGNYKQFVTDIDIYWRNTLCTLLKDPAIQSQYLYIKY
ncbi:MAG: hypothetical protein RI894_1615 [Bacteroidota bacterium]|jgi:hypothetical protein